MGEGISQLVYSHLGCVLVCLGVVVEVVLIGLLLLGFVCWVVRGVIWVWSSLCFVFVVLGCVLLC